MDFMKFLLMVIIVLALIGLIAALTAHAESHTGRMAAIVSFEDPERIGAIKDSVIGVCDTVRVPERWEIQSGFDALVEHAKTIITCRELDSYNILLPVTDTTWCIRKYDYAIKKIKHISGRLTVKWNPVIIPPEIYRHRTIRSHYSVGGRKPFRVDTVYTWRERERWNIYKK